ncbi:transposase [Parageobacillus thermoglucosidasius]|uniref:transposase n=1 Tax=Parageobacillus thermoglucosidasius TaxID=1426 RepID=UPI0021AB3EEB|nr:transposase [Parageobacillus thermoglucosidasius]
MKRLKITDDHGFTARKLRKEERKIKDASLRQRVTAVRLIMEGYLGKEVAEMLNLHRQSVSTYVQLFNEGGLEKLLDKKTPPGKSPYLTEEQQKKLKHMILHSTPFEQYVLLVLDNARIHHAKQVQEFLRKHEEPIMFFFLPPYSPHLNAIERLWKWLERVCHCQPISQRSSCH